MTSIAAGVAPDWVRSLRWKMAGLFILKLCLLTVLWALFFSPPHRIAVDSALTGNRFGVPGTQQKTAAAIGAARTSTESEKTRD